MSERQATESIRRALVQGCRGSDRSEVVVLRSDVETVLGAKAKGFLQKCGSGSTVTMVAVNRSLLLRSLERSRIDEPTA